ncbi:hypothetical protein SAMN06265375_101571 [Muriicola jejuensis]|nr:hypothetical protein SAMN06265375_101571 [Muriicola jejuensis]
MFLLLISYFVLTPFFNVLNGWDYAIYGIILSYFLSLNLLSFSYFKGLGQFTQELKAYSIFAAGILMFTGYFYFMSKDLADIRIIFLVLIGLNATIIAYTYLFSELRERMSISIELRQISIKQILHGLNKRKYFGFQDIVTAIYTQAGLLILFYIIDEKTYGYYRALFVIVAPLFMITVAISQVILNRLANSNKANILNLFRNIQRYTILLGIAICIMLLLMKRVVLSFINLDITYVSNLSFIIIVAITLMRFIFSNYEMLLVVYDMQKQRFVIMAIAAFIGISAIFVLLPRFGLVGAVTTNAISYFIVLLGLVMISEQKIRSLKK